MLIGLFLIFAALVKAIMDCLQFHYKDSPFAKFKKQIWWNPTISWKNKWRGGKPENGEKFPGSSTIFVWTTDAWHFFQMIFLTLMFLSIVFYTPLFSVSYSWVFDFIIYRIIFGVTFTLIFKRL